jgi:hypothetical protein
VRVGRAGGALEGFLQHDELAALQRAAHQGLVGQALQRVGAGDPQRLDLATRGGLEQLDGTVPGTGQRLVGIEPPECRHLGAVHGVGRVAVPRQQAGHATRLAPAHGIGLAGQREGAGARLADLPCGQVQVDEGSVLGSAALL